MIPGDVTRPFKGFVIACAAPVDGTDDPTRQTDDPTRQHLSFSNGWALPHEVEG